MPEDTTVSSDLSKDPFIQQLRSTLTQQGGIISSNDTQLDTKIDEAIKTVSGGAEATTKRIESEFGRERQVLERNVASSETAFVESNRGYAMNNAALKQLKDDNQKSLRDLDQRKQELILSGDAQAASQIAALQVEKIRFENEATQRAFSNLLSLGNFTIQQSSEERLARQSERTLNLQEQQAIANIGLQYGVEVKAGDTIETITRRAAPFASEKQKLDLDKTRAEIRRVNAETSRAIQEGANDSMSAADIEAHAQAFLLNPAVLSTVKNSDKIAAVINKANDLEKEFITRSVSGLKESGKTKTQAISELTTSEKYRITNPSQALQIVEELYKDGGKSSKKDPFAVSKAVRGLDITKQLIRGS